MVSIPSSWYFVCASKELTKGKVIQRTLNGISIVLFRNDTNAVVIMKSRCIHLGADLKSATVKNGNIVCPLHQWTFNSEGDCIHAKMHEDKIPKIKQIVLSSVEVCQSIFVFLGDKYFPFPELSFIDEFSFEPTPYVRLDTNWQSLASNSFDIEHLSVVHKRGLHKEPELRILSPHIMFMSYESYVLSNELSDKIMKFLSGNRIQVKVHNYGGTLLTIESQLKKRKAVLIFSFVPENEEFIRIHTIVGVPKKFPILDFIQRKISIYLYMSFLNRDFIAIRNLRVREENLASDQYLKIYAEYLKGLE
ncbi:aromatic ring-hydroxylating oxygenase subunit alpha [Leptospira meyeri]|uniref:aromatic ring-hydroxylating oxygenase subunit alpha n=1 Tax=Leptospira meyeri TaxID=29508 RepID=UPI000C2AB26E|nr:Rieske 2Fe-2S domain-containing protein [Leptospira meyeri]PKA25784.1 Rieske [Leptospira sp. mixed culture ATI2-C-A1]MCW7490840.1 Rieske 2Fe-2S domain-containing protein [Leptospira meyeri]PJZ79351.1 Rieske [Leptospira meyeri]PJZ95184.1 Rieske [Leptospira meyeri]PKA12520.1 Rieske [Leptospira meyeri]